MTQTRPELVMIYNADSGLLNAVRDSFWKTFAPASYPCALCALAFGFFTARREWKDFLARVPLEKRELHRDDYRQCLPGWEGKLPVILLHDADGALRVMVSADEMNTMDELDQLIGLAEQRLGEFAKG
ncbi:MAG: hypothetical protein WA985_02500 [Erythrobacter sp.]|uniref:hypothetical protein n=1 Tax=Erythrobacter sp. TaxID=1042 RepID=UPI003C72850D